MSSPAWLSSLTKVNILEFLSICYWPNIFIADVGFRSICWSLLARKTELSWTQIWDPVVPADVDDRLTLFFVLHIAKNLVKLSLSKARFWDFWPYITSSSSRYNTINMKLMWTDLSPDQQAQWLRNLKGSLLKKVEEYVDSSTNFLNHRALKCLVIRKTTILPKMLLKFVCKFPYLEMLDLTFCNNLSYRHIMWLRNKCPKLHDIRIIPHDLSGSMVTPFGHNGSDEIHTYYLDGAFKYARNKYSRGFCRVERMDDGWYKVYLEFIDRVGAVVLVKRFPDHFLFVNGRSAMRSTMLRCHYLPPPIAPMQYTRFPETTSQDGVERIYKMPYVGDGGKQPPLKLVRAIAVYVARKNNLNDDLH